MSRLGKRFGASWRAVFLRGGAGGKTGTIGITMTPVGQNVEYLRKLVEDGTVTCHQAPLTVEYHNAHAMCPDHIAGNDRSGGANIFANRPVPPG